MASTVYFVQNCPACGRSLQVKIAYLGKGVECQHCKAEFVASQQVASQQTEEEVKASESGLALLDRADELLKAVQEYKRRKLEEVGQ